MTDFGAVLRAFAAQGVEFIIIGGAAATIHGSARVTYDLDVVYRRSDDNIARLVAALAPHRPYLRGAPPGLPFIWDVQTVRQGLNFTLETALGDVDLLGEIVGGGGYESLAPHTDGIRAFGVDCLCLGLAKLIEVKRATGRRKDMEAIAELEAILEEKG